MSLVSPLEIAFLVSGFLKEEKYKKTYECFLKECQHLSAKSNAQINRQLKSLSSILNEYILLKEQQKQKQDFVRTFGTDAMLQNTLKNLCTLLDDYSSYRQMHPGATPAFEVSPPQLPIQNASRKQNKTTTNVPPKDTTNTIDNTNKNPIPTIQIQPSEDLPPHSANTTNFTIGGINKNIKMNSISIDQLNSLNSMSTVSPSTFQPTSFSSSFEENSNQLLAPTSSINTLQSPRRKSNTPRKMKSKSPSSVTKAIPFSSGPSSHPNLLPQQPESNPAPVAIEAPLHDSHELSKQLDEEAFVLALMNNPELQEKLAEQINMHYHTENPENFPSEPPNIITNVPQPEITSSLVPQPSQVALDQQPDSNPPSGNAFLNLSNNSQNNLVDSNNISLPPHVVDEIMMNLACDPVFEQFVQNQGSLLDADNANHPFDFSQNISPPISNNNSSNAISMIGPNSPSLNFSSILFDSQSPSYKSTGPTNSSQLLDNASCTTEAIVTPKKKRKRKSTERVNQLLTANQESIPISPNSSFGNNEESSSSLPDNIDAFLSKLNYANDPQT